MISALREGRGLQWSQTESCGRQMQLIGWFPFKLMVFKYLLSIHSEEVQCQLDEDTGALCCAKQFSFHLRTNSQKTVWLVIHHWSCREPLGNLTPPSISMKHSFYHREFSLRGVWWVEFLPSGHISNTARPPLCPALLCKEEAWLGASGLCKWSLWDLIGSCLILKKIMFIIRGKFCPHFTSGASCYLWSSAPLVEEKHRGGNWPAQRSQLGGNLTASTLFTQSLLLQTVSGGIHTRQNSKQAESTMRPRIYPKD